MWSSSQFVAGGPLDSRSHPGADEDDDGGDADQLAAQLQRVEQEILVVGWETEACLANLPAMRAVIRECAQSLRFARSELEDCRGQEEIREWDVKHLASTLEEAKLSRQAAVFTQEELQARMNKWLRQRVGELEQQEGVLLAESQTAKHDEARLLDEARWTLREHLDSEESHARHCEQVLSDCSEMDAAIQEAHQLRFAELRRDIEALRHAGQQREQEAAWFRREADECQRQWRGERSSLLRDIAYLESHLGETRAQIGELELGEESAACGIDSNDFTLGATRNRVQRLRADVDEARRLATEAEWELEALRAKHLRLHRRAMDQLQEDAMNDLEGMAVHASLAVPGDAGYIASRADAIR